MPEEIKKDKMTFERIWNCIHSRGGSSKICEVSEASNGGLLITLRDGDNRISILLSYEEAAALYMKLQKYLLK